MSLNKSVDTDRSIRRHVEANPQNGAILLPEDSEADPVISFVMPTLNEEIGIGPCIEAAKSALTDLGVTGEIIVSDSSTDRTSEIAREMGARVIRPDEPGYGYAYRYAFKYVRGDYVVIGDADATYDFQELPKLYARASKEDGYRTNGGTDGTFDTADLVMGSRFQGEILPGAMPALHRYLGNPLLTWFLNAFYDAGVTDAHSGFRVIRREALERMELTANGMEFASEMVMEAATQGMSIAEVPISYHARQGEATLESFPDGWRHMKFMLLNAPSYLFSVPGLGLGILGVVAVATSVFGPRFGSIDVTAHSMIMGSLLMIVGYQVAWMSVLATVAGDPIRKPNDRISQWIVDRFELKHGMIVGLGLPLISTAFAAYLAVAGQGVGLSEPPVLVESIVVITLIVFGVQTIFGSFFLSAIADED